MAGLWLVLPAQASAHHLQVSPPGQDVVVDHWVGGGPLPESAAGSPALIPSPIGLLPAAHGAGLVQACLATRANGNGVVAFIPPGPGGVNDADCRHGPP